MKSDKQVVTELDHLEMMNRPHLWPRWPVLPIKRWHEGTHVMDSAVIVEAEGDKVQFYRNANLFADPGTWGTLVLRTPKEIIAEGWVVD